MNDIDYNSNLFDGGILMSTLPGLPVSLAYNQYTTAHVTLIDSSGNPATSNPYFALSWVVSPGQEEILSITPSSDNLTCRIQQNPSNKIAGTYSVVFYMNVNSSGASLGLSSAEQSVLVTITNEPPLTTGVATSFVISLDPPQAIS